MRNYYGNVCFGVYREDYDFGDGYWATIEDCPDVPHLVDIWIHHTDYGIKMLAFGGFTLEEARHYMNMGTLGIYFRTYEDKYLTRSERL